METPELFEMLAGRNQNEPSDKKYINEIRRYQREKFDE